VIVDLIAATTASTGLKLCALGEAKRVFSGGSADWRD
jgi:hypothetical protein